jgi:hypothetical protein
MLKGTAQMTVSLSCIQTLHEIYIKLVLYSVLYLYLSWRGN